MNPPIPKASLLWNLSFDRKFCCCFAKWCLGFLLALLVCIIPSESEKWSSLSLQCLLHTCCSNNPSHVFCRYLFAFKCCELVWHQDSQSVPSYGLSKPGSALRCAAQGWDLLAGWAGDLSLLPLTQTIPSHGPEVVTDRNWTHKADRMQLRCSGRSEVLRAQKWLDYDSRTRGQRTGGCHGTASGPQQPVSETQNPFSSLSSDNGTEKHLWHAVKEHWGTVLTGNCTS